jgi:hypothetical protein
VQGSPSNGRPPVVRVRRPFATIDELLNADFGLFTRQGMVLAGLGPIETGQLVRFEVTLGDGAPILRGEGAVVAYHPRREGVPFEGVEVKFLRLDGRGHELMRRIWAMQRSQHADRPRPSRPRPEPPAGVTGTMVLGPSSSGTVVLNAGPASQASDAYPTEGPATKPSVGRAPPPPPPIRRPPVPGPDAADPTIIDAGPPPGLARIEARPGGTNSAAPTPPPLPRVPVEQVLPRAPSEPPRAPSQPPPPPPQPPRLPSPPHASSLTPHAPSQPPPLPPPPRPPSERPRAPSERPRARSDVPRAPSERPAALSGGPLPLSRPERRPPTTPPPPLVRAGVGAATERLARLRARALGQPTERRADRDDLLARLRDRAPRGKPSG